ncbi:MAG: hypothetical protein DMG14_34045 [Acidobacteria bacterium]|nr:MAG: hypothetical protein DMG14_34045 [Acidobacteriota bacterium]
MFVLLGPTLIMEKGEIMRSNIQTVYKAASVLGILGGSAVALHAILTRNEKQRLPRLRNIRVHRWTNWRRSAECSLKKR